MHHAIFCGALLAFLSEIQLFAAESPMVMEAPDYPAGESRADKRIAVPKSLWTKFERITAEYAADEAKNRGSDNGTPALPQKVSAWRIKLDCPYEVYVVKLAPRDWQAAIFIGDAKSARISKPYIMSTRDLETFRGENAYFQPPIIDYRDFDEDGTKELMIKELHHNGNMYFSEATNYFVIKDDLTLAKVMELQTKAFNIAGSFRRTIRTTSKKGRLEVMVEVADGEGSEEYVPFGSILFERPKGRLRYRITSQKARTISSRFGGHFFDAQDLVKASGE